MAPALGPILGGYLVQYATWLLILFVTVPIGVLGLGLAYVNLPSLTKGIPQRFDGWGLLLSSGGLFGILFVLSQASQWGWTSESSLFIGVTAVGALTLFVLWELRTLYPLIDLRVMRHRAFLLANGVMFVARLGLNAMIFYVPLYLQTVAGRSPLDAGLQMMPQALMIAVVMPVAGCLYNRIGARWLVVGGLALQA
jgi:MFS family permease